MISNNYNGIYGLYAPFINQVFNLLHRSRLPAMNLCTTDVSLGWMYKWFSFDKSADANSTFGMNDVGNMIYINLSNIINTAYEYNTYGFIGFESIKSFDIPTALLTTVAHELSHTEQDIDFCKYGDDDNYTNMIENANHFRTVKFLLEHKEFIENNIYFGDNPLKINESQLLLDYNVLKFAKNDFVHKEKIKSLFYKLNLLNLAETPDRIQVIRKIKNFIIKDINNREAIIKLNGRYVANYGDLWILNSLIYQIYHNYSVNSKWLHDINKINNNTIIVQSKFSA